MAQWTNRDIRTLKDDPNDYPWDDLRIAASSIGLPAANAPDPVAMRGTYVLGFDQTTTEGVYFECQLPHSWLEDSEIRFHIHWSLPAAGSGAGVENVKWDFTYSWANIGDVFPSETSATITVDVQNYAQYDHLVNEIVRIDGKGKRASSELLCWLQRDASVSDDYNNDALLVSADFHIQHDSNGSYFEYYKLHDYTNKKGTPKNPFKPGAW